jgi:hypothetical protein
MGRRISCGDTAGPMLDLQISDAPDCEVHVFEQPRYDTLTERLHKHKIVGVQVVVYEMMFRV